MNTRARYQATREEAKALHKNTRERLKYAKMLMEAGGYRDSISRSYYAILDAARALLLSEGHFAKTHDGVITSFSLKFIQTKRVEPKYSRIFVEVKNDRLEADYKFLEEFTPKKAQEAYKKAKEFVKMADGYLKKNLKDGKGSVAIKSILW